MRASRRHATRMTSGTVRMTDPDDHVNSAALDVGVCGVVCLAIEPLIAALDRLAGALHNKGRELEIILTAARTDPQDAAPVMLGQEFDAFAAAVSEDRRALQHLQQRFAYARPEICLELCRTLRRTAMKVSLICQDLRRLAAVPHTGLAEIILPARQAGIVEHDARIFAQHDVTATMPADGRPINPFEPVLMRALLESLQWMTGAIVTLRVNCIEGIAANAARVDAFLAADRLTRH